MVTRIISPQLYQLSYRPKIAELIGNLLRRLGKPRAVVSPVYPDTASECNFVGIPARTSGGFS